MYVFLIIFYVIGIFVSIYLMYKMSSVWSATHVNDTYTYYEYGFWVVSAFLSWFSVCLIILCGIAGANRIDDDYHSVSSVE